MRHRLSRLTVRLHKNSADRRPRFSSISRPRRGGAGVADDVGGVVRGEGRGVVGVLERARRQDQALALDQRRLRLSTNPF